MTIKFFKGKYAGLSNFSPINLELDGRIWPTSEHMFMACKTVDPVLQEQIRMAYTPGYAKKLGRQVLLRPDWDIIKVPLMLRILRLKFEKSNQHQELLLSTGCEELIEGNYWHDNFWGSCHCNRCKNQGKNMLGILLMQVRDEIKLTLKG